MAIGRHQASDLIALNQHWPPRTGTGLPVRAIAPWSFTLGLVPKLSGSPRWIVSHSFAAHQRFHRHVFQMACLLPYLTRCGRLFDSTSSEGDGKLLFFPGYPYLVLTVAITRPLRMASLLSEPPMFEYLKYFSL